MGNVKQLMEDVLKRAEFVETVVTASYQCKEVHLNDGIATPEELEALVCQEPIPFAEYNFSKEEK
jgi:hypothetical protein